ncbi:elongation factor Tu [archaeon]|nr:elongation factor Tu [archaeon]
MLSKKKVKMKFERVKPHCNIGTIGHVDHGKTTLTAAITKLLQNVGNTVFKSYSDIDNNIDERNRGITINASHVEYETVKRHYSHIDCPGHQQYIKHMLTGAIQMEGAILVVSVNDGPQVQTREHVILAKEIGITHMVVFINKLDSLIEVDMKDLVELEVRELLEQYNFPGDLPVIKGSAKVALDEALDQPSELGLLSVKSLMDTVDTYIPQPDRAIDAPFLLPIEAVYVITGRGTVVTGKIEQGTLKEGQEIELLGKDVKKTTCLGIEMFHKLLSVAEVGDNVGILIKNIKKDQVSRGNVLADPGFMKIYKIFEAKVYILSKKEGGRHKPFVSNYKPQFFFRTSNITGTISLPEEISVVLPGDSVTFNVTLADFCPLNLGLRFIIREGTLTIGAGVITKLL